jgi:hypothetical protein
LALAIFLTGCGRHRGSGNPAATDAPTLKLLSANIQMPKAQPGSSIRAAIKASSLTIEALTDAIVVVILKDGSELPLEKDPNTPGLYNLFANAGSTLTYPFVIEAKKGGILIQNIITDSSETKTNITCDHTTTAFTQAALITAKMDNNGATLQDVISAGSSLSFDLARLKEMFTQDTAPLTPLLEQIIEKVVETLTTASIDDEEVKVADLTDLQFEIKNIAPTITDEDVRAAITTVVNDFVELFKKAHNTDINLGDNIEDFYTEEEMDIISEDFIISGFDRESFLDGFEAKLFILSELNQFGNIYEITQINHNINLRKLADDLYLVHLDGTMDFSNRESENKTYSFNSTEQGYICNQTTFDIFEHFNLPNLNTEFNYFPIMVRKEGTSWKVIGNQVRAEAAGLYIERWYDVEILDSELTNKESHNKISGFGLFGADYSALTIEAENKKLVYHPNERNGHELHITPKVGHTFKFEAEFDDGDDAITQTYTHKIQNLYPLNENMFTITRAGNEVTITWPQAKANDFLYYAYGVYVYDEDDNEIGCTETNGDYIMDATQNSVIVELEEGHTEDDIAEVHIEIDIETKSGIMSCIDYYKEFTNE